MTKRADVIRTIGKAAKAAGVELAQGREGAKHTIYLIDGVMVPIPRHSEIDRYTAEAIYKECEPILGKGWWRR